MSKFNSLGSPWFHISRYSPLLGNLRRLYFQYNPFDDEFIPQGVFPEGNLPFLQQGLNPLLAMKKDLFDTFKPYKSMFYIKRDLMQPIRGLGNLFKGLMDIPGALLYFFLDSLTFLSTAGVGAFISTLPLRLLNTVGQLLGGVSSMIRGLTQIASSVFMPLRILLRLGITYREGMPSVEKNQSLANKVAQLRAMFEFINAGSMAHADDLQRAEQSQTIDREMSSILLKLQKASRRGQQLFVYREDNVLEVTWNSYALLANNKDPNKYNNPELRASSLRFLDLVIPEEEVEEKVEAPFNLAL